MLSFRILIIGAKKSTAAAVAGWSKREYFPCGKKSLDLGVNTRFPFEAMEGHCRV